MYTCAMFRDTNILFDCFSVELTMIATSTKTIEIGNILQMNKTIELKPIQSIWRYNYNRTKFSFRSEGKYLTVFVCIFNKKTIIKTSALG